MALSKFLLFKKNSYSYKNLAFVISQYKNQFFVLYAKRQIGIPVLR